MTECGNCGNPVANDDVTCSHCDAVLAAWTPATDSEETHTRVQPDYARPPAHTPLFPVADSSYTSVASGLPDEGQQSLSGADVAPDIDRAAAIRLINTIKAYIHKREAASQREHAGATPSVNGTSSLGDHVFKISNIAFAIGTFLIVIIIIMWGIVAAMVFTDMVSVEFIAITIVLTLAFKPTINSLRRIFDP